MKEQQPPPLCYNDQGISIDPITANCSATEVEGYTLSVFHEACPNGLDYITINGTNGEMIPLMSRSLCYKNPNLFEQNGEVVFHGDNEFGMYETWLGPVQQIPTVEYTPVLIPTPTPLPEPTSTEAFITEAQPLIEIQPTPDVGCLGSAPLGLLAIGAFLLQRYRHR